MIGFFLGIVVGFLFWYDNLGSDLFALVFLIIALVFIVVFTILAWAFSKDKHIIENRLIRIAIDKQNHKETSDFKEIN